MADNPIWRQRARQKQINTKLSALRAVVERFLLEPEVSATFSGWLHKPELSATVSSWLHGGAALATPTVKGE
ncbi:hypothetical protein P5673_029634 [Acropora cervicornis]|uniref:Uncharacterized protein n=1 Tax=Acropora cervicornis TaxID=6130 RepID=A0AAD9UU63_ACRCE|nr:hypothetical protein P5673_029634 [Acropora cervicornis]